MRLMFVVVLAALRILAVSTAYGVSSAADVHPGVSRGMAEEASDLGEGEAVDPSAIITDSDCDATAGEEWCQSREICHKPWESVCPTSAPCSADDDCVMRMGGCGPYACQCLVYGVDESMPNECPPEFTGVPCACADCLPGACTDASAACLDGVCGVADTYGTDTYGCNTARGEEWCESLGRCHKPWEVICPTSASCGADDECEMQIGSCGIYMCQCIVKGIVEAYPQECSNLDDDIDPCACARCTAEACAGSTAACINGVCGFSSEAVGPDGTDVGPDDVDVGPDEMVDENGCDVSAGETWCRSLETCHKQWETACPTSATCSSNADCQMRIGGCGPYGCQCFAYGVDEPSPQECSPFDEENPCICAACLPDTCSDTTAVCTEGVCGLSSDEEDPPYETVENGCNAATGETWCESLGMCHKQFESICPTSAPCTMDDECTMRIGGCGIYACKCLVMGANETTPQECSPVAGEPCPCAGCSPGTCSDVRAACVDGFCSSAVAPPSSGTSNALDIHCSVASILIFSLFLQ